MRVSLLAKFTTKAAPLRTWLITLFLLAVVAASVALYAITASTGIGSILDLLAQ
jgi:hypothetical protein